jgi:hypothetical protein
MNYEPGVEVAATKRASICSLTVRGSEQAGFGWVCMNPVTVSRLGLKPGDSVWLNDEGTPAPFSIESREDVKCGEAWLNAREMAAMEVRDGAKLTASGADHGPSLLPEELEVYGRIGVMAGPPDRTAVVR